MLYAECFLMQRFIVSEMSEDGLRTAQGAGQESCGEANPGHLRLRTVVRPERFELPTYCSGGLAAREINGLARLAWSEIRQYLCGVLASMPFQKQT